MNSIWWGLCRRRPCNGKTDLRHRAAGAFEASGINGYRIIFSDYKNGV